MVVGRLDGAGIISVENLLYATLMMLGVAAWVTMPFWWYRILRSSGYDKIKAALFCAASMLLPPVMLLAYLLEQRRRRISIQPDLRASE